MIQLICFFTTTTLFEYSTNMVTVGDRQHLDTVDEPTKALAVSDDDGIRMPPSALAPAGSAHRASFDLVQVGAW
jgi:hypothetical protein